MNEQRRRIGPADLPDTSSFQAVAAGVLLLVLLCLSPGWAEAHEFQWVAPTEYVNGAELDPADLAEFRLYCAGAVVDTFPGEARAGAVPFAPGSTHTCHLTAVDVDANESDPSNEVTITEPASRPKPPVLSGGAGGG